MLLGKIRELLWIGLLTHPDLSFDINLISSNMTNGIVSSMKFINSDIKKAKGKTRLDDLSNLVLNL